MSRCSCSWTSRTSRRRRRSATSGSTRGASSARRRSLTPTSPLPPPERRAARARAWGQPGESSGFWLAGWRPTPSRPAMAGRWCPGSTASSQLRRRPSAEPRVSPRRGGRGVATLRGLFPALAVVALPACGQEGPRTRVDEATGVVASAEIRLVESVGDRDQPFAFQPALITVRPGTTVRWVNESDAYHTLTFTDSIVGRQSNVRSIERSRRRERSSSAGSTPLAPTPTSVSPTRSSRSPEGGLRRNEAGLGASKGNAFRGHLHRRAHRRAAHARAAKDPFDRSVELLRSRSASFTSKSRSAAQLWQVEHPAAGPLVVVAGLEPDPDGSNSVGR